MITPPRAPVPTIIQGLFFFAPPSGWIVSALKTTAPIAITIVGMTALFGMQVGPLSLLGAMTAVWGRERPFRSGVLTMGIWTLGITASLAIGVLAAPFHWLALLATIALALIGVAAYNLLPSNGPGPLNLFFACALGSYLGTLGNIAWRAVLVTLLSGLLTTALCQAHLIRDPHGPERRAVERAEAAMNDYVNREPAPAARWLAHRSLHRATVTLHAAHRTPPAAGTHKLLADRLALVATRLHIHERRRLGLTPDTTSPESILRPGRPSLAYLVAREFRQHTFGRLTALRVGVGLALAGLATTLIGTEHFYWSILTAGVILHIGPNRAASVERALHRSLGTVAGVGLVALLTLWAPPAPVELVIVVIGAFGMNLFLAHHYALAIMCVTPMSLMVTNVMSPGMLPGILIQDRIVETLIGATAAVLATALFSVRGLQAIVLGQLRGTATTVSHLINHLDCGSERTPAGAQLARDLAFELDTTGATVRRASIEAPGLWNLAASETALVDLGYDTLVSAHNTHRHTRTLRDQLTAISLPLRKRGLTSRDGT